MINNQFDNEFLDYEVDYTKSVVASSVYLTLYLISLNESYAVCWYNRKSKSDPKLPSWALDLNDLRVESGGSHSILSDVRRRLKGQGHITVNSVAPFTLVVEGIRQGRLGHKRTPYEDCACCEGEWRPDRVDFEDKSDGVTMSWTEVFHTDISGHREEDCIAPAYAQRDDVLVEDLEQHTLILRPSQNVREDRRQTYEFIGVAWFESYSDWNRHKRKLQGVSYFRHWSDPIRLGRAKKNPETYAEMLETYEYALRSDGMSEEDWQNLLEMRKQKMLDLARRGLLDPAVPASNTAVVWRECLDLPDEEARQWLELTKRTSILEALHSIETFEIV